MMTAVGLGVSIADLTSVAKNVPLLIKAAIANYICVPVATVVLLLFFHAQPMVAAGFLILAVCPGAPFGPPCTAIAKGNVAVSVGLMVVLAGSSALVAPLLLGFLLPVLSGNESLMVDPVNLAATLLLTQLIPLCAGLIVRQWRPALAMRLQKPANRLSALLNLTVVGFILATQFGTLAAIRPRAWTEMTALLIASLAIGWLMGGPATENRKAMTLTTSLRNVGVGLVIAANSFPAALTATLAYGLFELSGSFLLAFRWGRPKSVHGPKRVELENATIVANAKGTLS
jgi:bile acid:Na+ symporter, BASS family